jgi:hypothetical protein
MTEPRTKGGRDLVARNPELRDTVLAIETEAAIDEERLARAIARLWPSRRARETAASNARAVVAAYKVERPEAKD